MISKKLREKNSYNEKLTDTGRTSLPLFNPSEISLIASSKIRISIALSKPAFSANSINLFGPTKPYSEEFHLARASQEINRCSFKEYLG